LERVEVVVPFRSATQPPPLRQAANLTVPLDLEQQLRLREQ
jgi:hypothetical protein